MGLGSGLTKAARSPQVVLLLLTGLVLLVHGYHPYAEDGGLYVAGIKKVLDPGLYGAHAEFVTAPMRFSLFAPLMAGLVRATGVSVPWMLLAIYGTTAWLTLFAAWRLAGRFTGSEPGRLGAVTLVACWFALPVAGTSLLLMDPYVTARSFSTPLTLLALGEAMEVRGDRWAWLRCCGWLGLAALVHPLMAGYGCVAVALLAMLGSRRRWVRVGGAVAVAGAGMIAAAVLQARTPPESAAYVRVAMTRTYWFLSQWAWYERVGAIVPLLVIAGLDWRGRERGRTLLARTALVLGGLSLLVAVGFARAGLEVHAVARLQPLRCLQLVYVVMTLLLGAWLGEQWLGTRPLRWCGMVALAGGALFVAERRTYPASAHLEMPWQAPVNRWEQGFVWARDHTPKEALFALDARYITRGKGEDAQGFRAVAERDVLADYSKDGGEAAIAPQLTAAWVRGQAAQTGLEQRSDTAREAALRPLGIAWVILETGSRSGWDCPYVNDTVKVCRLPGQSGPKRPGR